MNRRPGPLATASIVLVLLVVLLVVFWDWNWFRGPLAGAISARIDRPVSIAWLDVDLSLTPRIRIGGLRVGNAPWSDRPPLAQAEELDFYLDLRALWERRIRLPQVTLRQPVVRLERSPDGRANWDLGNPAPDPQPESGSDWGTPQVERLTVSGGRLEFLDPTTASELAILADSLPDESLHLTGEGRVRDEPFALDLEVGSPLALQDRQRPYPVGGRLTVGETRAEGQGTVTDPLALAGLDMALTVQGPDPKVLEPLVGIPLPSLPPYRIGGTLHHDGALWQLTGLDGRVGDSDLAGSVLVESRDDRPPRLEADLVSRRLDFDDLAGLVGGTPDPEETASPQQQAQARSSDRVISDQPFDLAGLNALEAVVSFQGERVNAPNLPLDQVNFRVELAGGVLKVTPLDFGIGGGRIRVWTTLDASGRPPGMDLIAELEGVDLKGVLADTPLATDSAGRIGGRLELGGQGDSPAAVLGGADGHLTLLMTGGRIDGLLIEAAGLDAAEVLGVLLAEERGVEIRCALVDFRVRDGLMTSQALVLDTDDTRVEGEGQVSLARETLDLTLTPHPKDVSLLTLRSPLRIDGPWRQPALHPQYEALAARGVAAVALGTLIAPAAALLALVEPGSGESSDCARLFREGGDPQEDGQDGEGDGEKPVEEPNPELQGFQNKS